MTREDNSLILELRYMFLSSHVVWRVASAVRVRTCNLGAYFSIDHLVSGFQIFKAFKCFHLLATDHDLTADTIGFVKLITLFSSLH